MTTTPVPTPDAPRPITDPPAELVEGLKGLMPFLEKLISLDSDSRTTEGSGLTQGSADFLRKLFPHLDDLTLASFCSYVAVNIVSLIREDLTCPDTIRIAMVYADIAKALAWSLNTPEAPEPTGRPE